MKHRHDLPRKFDHGDCQVMCKLFEGGGTMFSNVVNIAMRHAAWQFSHKCWVGSPLTPGKAEKRNLGDFPYVAGIQWLGVKSYSKQCFSPCLPMVGELNAVKVWLFLSPQILLDHT